MDAIKTFKKEERKYLLSWEQFEHDKNKNYGRKNRALASLSPQHRYHSPENSQKIYTSLVTHLIFK